ncbi:MAG: hypothetical protein EAY81_04980 [Bacteroidetes bacterium]|nr:MAG: hypothetical protein EAY81_04980 [Bacteroidota bacterium]
MSTKYLLAFGIIIPLLLHGQKPEHIYSFATSLKPVDWYKQQKELWKKEIGENQANSYAWYNYYRSSRNAVRTDTTDKRSHEQKANELRSIVEEMGKAVPESFEYNLCKWMNEGNNLAYISYLEQAEKLGEGRTEHLSDLIVWGELERNTTKRDKYSLAMFEGKECSPGLLYYNHNVLMGLKENAIIVTCGDNDTYPLWMLQAKGIRRDVTVINASLIRVDSYRNKLFKELGIQAWESDEQLAKKNPNSVDINTRYEKTLITHLAKNTKSLPVYLVLTCGESYSNPIADQLYLTGLAYEYSEKSIDNIAWLKRNFEQVYTLDYIEKSFFYDISAYYTNLTTFNYVVPMVKLYDHYKTANELDKAERIKKRVLFIVKGRAEENDIKNYFTNP